jgi:HK97 gp10 family phage protein
MARARNWGCYIEGAKELNKMFGDMVTEAEKILDEAAKNAGNLVKDSAKGIVKKDTGKLSESIDIKPVKNKQSTRRSYQVYSKGKSQGGVRYAAFVELGTSKAKAQPYLRPAMDRNKSNIQETIIETIGKGVDKAVKK